MIQHENREVQRAIEVYQAAQKFAEECKCGECPAKEKMAEPRKAGIGRKLGYGAGLYGGAAVGQAAGGLLGGSIAVGRKNPLRALRQVTNTLGRRGATKAASRFIRGGAIGGGAGIVAGGYLAHKLMRRKK